MSNSPFRSAKSRPPLKCVRLFCLDCMGGSRGLVRECREISCPLHAYRFGVVEEGVDPRVLRAVRRQCLACVDGDREAVRFCTGEEVCVLWPFRFGVSPQTVEAVRRRLTAPRELALPGLEAVMSGKRKN